MKFTVTSNQQLNATTWLMRLEGDTSSLTRPGQFVNIAVEGFFLRRPISVCDYDDNSMLLCYEVVGHGTAAMANARPGQQFDLLSGLGNGFDHTRDVLNPVLMGGGIGVAPLYGLAKELLRRDIQPVAVLGYNSADRMVMDDMFRELNIETIVATVDGSAGVKGFVTDALRSYGIKPDYMYGCGPMPMLEALCKNVDIPGELSLDVRMACGFGACMCCSFQTTNGPVCVCKDGPVFDKNELIWQQ